MSTFNGYDIRALGEPIGKGLHDLAKAQHDANKVEAARVLLASGTTDDTAEYARRKLKEILR